MRIINFLLLVIFIIQPVSALGYTEHINYLAKVIPEVSMSASSFADIDLTTNTELVSWLKDLDTKLNPRQLGTYGADFLLSFSTDGHINAISVSELREQNLDKFRFFIAKLQTVQAQPLPSKISSETVFKLDGHMLYLERNESYLKTVNGTRSTVNGSHVEFITSELVNYFQSSSEIRVELLEPGYIDYPRVGEALVFQLNDPQYKGLKLYAHIISIEDQAMLIKLNRANDKLINLVFKINRPSKDSRSTLVTVINSGLGSAMGAGLTASVASHGIVPGVLALTNMAGTLMQEREELLSFNLIKGDEVMLVKGEERRLVSKSHNAVMDDLGTRLKEK